MWRDKIELPGESMFQLRELLKLWQTVHGKSYKCGGGIGKGSSQCHIHISLSLSLFSLSLSPPPSLSLLSLSLPPSLSPSPSLLISLDIYFSHTYTCPHTQSYMSILPLTSKHTQLFSPCNEAVHLITGQLRCLEDNLENLSVSFTLCILH